MSALKRMLPRDRGTIVQVGSVAESLARQGRVEDAREVFDRALATGNDLGLFSEEYDTQA